MVVGAVAALAPAPGPAAAAAPPDNNAVVARIGDTEVKAEEVRAALEALPPRDQAALAQNPALLGQTVRTLLVRRLVLKEALAKRWDREPAAAALLERLRENAVTDGYLQQVAQPPADYPPEAELQRAYDNNKAALLVPRQFQLAQVFVALPKGADKTAADKAQAKLEIVRKALRARDVDFAALARSESDERTSAERGGELGWLTEAQLQPEIRPSVAGLAKGGVSEPVRLDDGWHVLKALDVKDPYVPALDEVRAQLAQQLRAERARANAEAYLARLLQQNPVFVNELALSRFLAPTPKTPPR